MDNAGVFLLTMTIITVISTFLYKKLNFETLYSSPVEVDGTISLHYEPAVERSLKRGTKIQITRDLTEIRLLFADSSFYLQSKDVLLNTKNGEKIKVLVQKVYSKEKHREVNPTFESYRVLSFKTESGYSMNLNSLKEISI